eukprot:1624127-Pyramimonas_sp.AAC.1
MVYNASCVRAPQEAHTVGPLEDGFVPETLGELPVHLERVGRFLYVGVNPRPEVSPNMRLLEDVAPVVPKCLSRGVGRFNRVPVVAIDANEKSPSTKTTPELSTPSAASKER